MRPRFALVAAMLVGLATITTPVASASSPPTNAVQGYQHQSGDIPDAGLCATPVASHYEDWVPYTDYTLKDGKIREVGKWTERDTFTANGKTVVGDLYTYHYTILASDANFDSNTVIYSYVIVGTIFNVKLPHGPKLVTWGYVDVTNVPLGVPFWTVDYGHNADYKLLCAYFFG